MEPWTIQQALTKNQFAFNKVVPFDEDTNKLLLMDLTQNNNSLTSDIYSNTTHFAAYINNQLSASKSTYGIGGYGEHRTIYAKSEVFDTKDEPRRLHLGIDIWGEVGTPIYAPLGGMVHSFAYNAADGDYGATIILLHQLDAIAFYTLYGHLSLRDIAHLKEGSYISGGQEFAHFGEPAENGNWPPHLHFQVINDIDLKEGDYPGVCKFSERAKYLHNCPNPDLILQMMAYAKPIN